MASKQPEQLWLKVSEAQIRYNLCRASIMKIATDAGAVARVGRAIRISVPIMDRAMEAMAKQTH